MSQPISSVQSMLDSVVRAGKSTVRKIETADIERFIQSQANIDGKVSIRNLRGNAKVGASSGIVLFTADYRTEAGPVTRELVLRHAPGSETRLFHEYDLARQFKVQRALQGSGVPVPEPLWLDADGAYLGVPGYIMELVSGEAPHASAFAIGPLAQAAPADREVMLDAVMKALVGIHSLDCTARGLGDFTMNAAGDTPMQRCINWYWQSWEWFNLPEYARLQSVHRWLLDHAPSGGVTLMHGDASLHNYMFRGTQLVAVVDWEMSCLGRPEADVALQCMGNELFAAPPGSGAPMPPTQQEWLARYEKAGGRKLEHFDYFKKFALYMVVICVQGLQRNLPAEVRAAQQPFSDRCWAMLES